MTWAAVITTCLGCYLLKLGGMVVPQRWLADPRTSRVAALLPVALLAALIAVGTFGHGAGGTGARVVGVAAAAVAVWRRAPFIVVVVLAAAVTATVRAVL